MDPSNVKHEPYPATSKKATGKVNAILTEASSTIFVDKIMIKISQDGRLSQWIQVPISSDSPSSLNTTMRGQDLDSLLPLNHLTPMTLLGAGGDQRETLGHLIATQIASTILTKNPEETRTVLVGLGLQKANLEREGFFDIVELVQKVL